MSNAKMMWRKTPNSREEMPEYVERSYHEALVNALAHRDYLVNGSEVHIDTNYSEDKKPSFRSDRYQFTVIMPNLNYGVDNANGIKDTNHDTIDTNRDTNDLETRLLNCINENAGFTQKVYAEMLNVSVPTIKRLFARLQKENVLKREGTNRKGQWIIIEDKKEKL